MNELAIYRGALAIFMGLNLACANDSVQTTVAPAASTSTSTSQAKDKALAEKTDRNKVVKDQSAAGPKLGQISSGQPSSADASKSQDEEQSPPPKDAPDVAAQPKVEPPAPPPPTPVPASPCIDADDFTCKAEEALVKYTNETRARAGRPPLQQNYKISYVSRAWSKEQGASISHNGFPNARSAAYQQRFAGESTPPMLAENVAMFGGGGSDPDTVGKTFADQWESSPGHYNNIIGNYGSIGVGIVCTGASGGDSSPFGFGGFGGATCTGTQIFSN